MNKAEIIIEVTDYVKQAEGTFSLREIADHLNLHKSSEKKEVKRTLLELCRVEDIKPVSGRDGFYKKINKVLDKINWQDAKVEHLPLDLPLNLCDKVVVQPGSIIVIAGVSNAGKSGFLLEIANKNRDKFVTDYYASEWSDSGLRDRLENFGEPMDSWNTINFFDRSSDFVDVVKPNGLSIIDFLEVHEDFFRVGAILQGIREKLDRGVCIVAMQKSPGSQFGKGGHTTIEKPLLYLTIDDGILTVEKLKQPPKGVKNINGLSINYRYGKGGRLLVDGFWGRKEKKKCFGKPDITVIQPVYWANDEYKESGMNFDLRR